MNQTLFLDQLFALRDEPRPKVLLVSHGIGGGVQRHLHELAVALPEVRFLCLRSADGGRVRLSLSLGAEEGWLEWRAGGDRLLEDALRIAGVGRLHYHHLAGFSPWVVELPGRLGLPYDVTVHDFFWVGGDPTLTGPSGQFQRDRIRRDAGLSGRTPWGSLAHWQGRVAPFLRGAERVLVPTEAARAILADYFPDPNYRLAAHPDLERDHPYPSPTLPRMEDGGRAVDAPARVLVLGALGREKGAERLEETARLATRRGAPLRFHLIGYAFRHLDPAIQQHGPYREEELPDLVADISPALVWFPARCAETYSYTLSHALRLGLPVLAPDLGAFPERLAERPLSWLFAAEATAPECLERLLRVRDELSALPRDGDSLRWESQPAPGAQGFLYSRDYVILPRSIGGQEEMPSLQGMESLVHRQALAGRYRPPDGEPQGLRIRLLRLLIRGRNGAAGRWLQRHLPYHLQRWLKRSLSRRPLAEIETTRKTQ